MVPTPQMISDMFITLMSAVSEFTWLSYNLVLLSIYYFLSSCRLKLFQLWMASQDQLWNLKLSQEAPEKVRQVQYRSVIITLTGSIHTHTHKIMFECLFLYIYVDKIDFYISPFLIIDLCNLKPVYECVKLQQRLL